MNDSLCIVYEQLLIHWISAATWLDNPECRGFHKNPDIRSYMVPKLDNDNNDLYVINIYMLYYNGRK